MISIVFKRESEPSKLKGKTMNNKLDLGKWEQWRIELLIEFAQKQASAIIKDGVCPIDGQCRYDDCTEVDEAYWVQEIARDLADFVGGE